MTSTPPVRRPAARASQPWLFLVPGLLAVAGSHAAGNAGNTDTGIRRYQCYAAGSDVLVPCSTSTITGQDGQLGRDTSPKLNGSSDGTLGFSYTKVCNSGESAGTGTCPADPALGSNPDDWACVIDNVTGVWWEVKTATGLRARSKTYTNYSPTYDPLGQFRSATDAEGYVSRVNQSMLCGHDDWGLAHTSRVQSVFDYGFTTDGQTRLDPVFLPNFMPGYYWNNSPNPTSTTTAFAVDYLTGTTVNTMSRDEKHYAQVLRNSKARWDPNGHYQYSPDGAQVHDTTTNALLIWRRCVEGMSWTGTGCTGTPLLFTHEQSLQWAMQQAAATGQPWRVPSVKEQNWLVQRTINSPPIDHGAFPDTPRIQMWTSSPETRQPSLAWEIDFLVGEIHAVPRTEQHALRLVRDEDGSPKSP